MSGERSGEVPAAEVVARVRRRVRWLVALAVWTVVLWGTRMRNIAADDELQGADAVRPTTVALGFTLLGVVVLVGMWRGRAWRWPVVSLLIALTLLYWPIRMVQIGLADHSAGFVAVHAVLAVVSMALAARGLPWPVRQPAEVRASR